jgi:hypothetical protein
VKLTARGRRTARRLSAARLAVLDDALSVLSEEERETLDMLVSRVLVGLKRPAPPVRHMCRLCDATACGHADGHCPVYQR